MMRKRWLELKKQLNPNMPESLLTLIEATYFAGAAAMHELLLDSPEAAAAMAAGTNEAHSQFLGGIKAELSEAFTRASLVAHVRGMDIQ